MTQGIYCDFTERKYYIILAPFVTAYTISSFAERLCKEGSGQLFIQTNQPSYRGSLIKLCKVSMLMNDF